MRKLWLMSAVMVISLVLTAGAFDNYRISKPVDSGSTDNNPQVVIDKYGIVTIGHKTPKPLPKVNSSGIALDVPPNDNCENAQPINLGDSLVFYGDEATFDGLAGYVNSANIWYSYSAPETGPVQFCVYDTTGSPFLVTVYDGLSCDGYTPPPTPTALQCGETIDAAVPISSTLPASYTGSLAGLPDTYIPSCAINENTRDGFYSYTADFTGTINIAYSPADTASWPPLISILDSEGNELMCSKNDNWPKTWIVDFPVESGVKYYIVISSGFEASENPQYVLTISSPDYTVIDVTNIDVRYDFYAIAGHQYLIELGCIAWGGYTYPLGNGYVTLNVAPDPPLNDDCENATVIGDGILHNNEPMQFSGNNIGATEDCPVFDDARKVWIKFTTENVMDINLDLCGTVNREPNTMTFSVNLSNSCPCNPDCAVWGKLDDLTPFIYDCPNPSPNIYWGALPAGTYYYPMWSSYIMEGDYVINVTGLTIQECSDLSLYGDAPSTTRQQWEFFVSDTLTNYIMADNFSGIADTVSRVTWWGTAIDTEEAPCYPGTMEFEIIFCESDFGTPGEIVAVSDVSIVPEETGRIYAELLQMKFVAQLDEPLVMENGWLIIKGKGSNDCAFAWQNAGGGGSCKQYNRNTSLWSTIESGLSFCLEKDTTMVGITEDDFPLPSATELLTNYPNPFNATTSIEFSLAKTDDISLSIYDIGGRLIKSLYNGTLAPGMHKLIWDGTNESGETVSSGIYFYRLQCSQTTLSKTMVLLK